MNDEDKSIDLTGVGKLAKAIPPSSWNRLVKTACDTFCKLISPIIETTSGLGRLIKAKFESMEDIQKVLATDALKRTQRKIEDSGKRPKGNPKSPTLIKLIENASNEPDENIRDIWANMIANEILNNRVHPEFPKIMTRLSSNDAITLVEIAESNKKASLKAVLGSLIYGFRIMGFNFSLLIEEETDFSREQLMNLNLVCRRSGHWYLTLTGEEFLKAVADPSFDPSNKKE